MPRICVDLDNELFKKFSLKVVEEGKKKKDVLIELIRRYVEE